MADKMVRMSSKEGNKKDRNKRLILLALEPLASKNIPSLADAAALEHPGFNYIVTTPLGLHELLVDAVKDRIDYCLSHVVGEVKECAGTGRTAIIRDNFQGK